jgi:mycothiol synthase
MNVRPFTRSDADRVAELARSEVERLFGRPSHINGNDVLGWLQEAALDDDSFLVEENGDVIGAAVCNVREGRGSQWGVVAGAAQGRGIGARLLDLSEARVAEKDGKRLHAWTFGGDERADALFRSRGYDDVRRFWEMEIELDGPPPKPAAAVETFRASEARAFYEALDDAFQDHWEHHARPFDEWWANKQNAPDFDPSVWFLIRDGDEIAAVVRNDPDRNGGAEVGALGVRRPWRGKGYGRALLLHTFGEFYRRGTTRITLGVDSANPTGATKLYESVGMRVANESVIYERLFA